MKKLSTGATGVRLVTTAANRLAKENGRLAMVSACAGGGIVSVFLFIFLYNNYFLFCFLGRGHDC